MNTKTSVVNDGLNHQLLTVHQLSAETCADNGVCPRAVKRRKTSRSSNTNKEEVNNFLTKVAATLSANAWFYKISNDITIKQNRLRDHEERLSIIKETISTYSLKLALTKLEDGTEELQTIIRNYLEKQELEKKRETKALEKLKVEIEGLEHKLDNGPPSVST